MTYSWFPDHCSCELVYNDHSQGQVPTNLNKINRCQGHNNILNDNTLHGIHIEQTNRKNFSISSLIKANATIPIVSWSFDISGNLIIKITGLTSTQNTNYMTAIQNFVTTNNLSINVGKIILQAA